MSPIDRYDEQQKICRDITELVRKLDFKLSKERPAKVNFRLHQRYEAIGSTEQYLCTDCGCGEFYVGLGSHFTVAKCIRCDHEECIHDG